MNDYLDYLSGINQVQAQPQDPGTNAGAPSFWQNFGAAASRAASAGGGLPGVASAFSPSFAAPYASNRPTQVAPQNSGMYGINSAQNQNSQAASSASGGIGKLAGGLAGLSL